MNGAANGDSGGMNAMLKSFIPDIKNERPTDQFDRDQVARWCTVPVADRKHCVAALHKAFAGTNPVLMATWRRQRRENRQIGSDDLRFHFAVGMQIRNLLRAALPDDKLPPVEQPGGEFATNWDDYYIGALHEALARVPSDPGYPVNFSAPANSDAPLEQPTHLIRKVKRRFFWNRSEIVDQQCWIIFEDRTARADYRFEWRDVPVIEEPA